jgi:hypothetical protein
MSTSTASVPVKRLSLKELEEWKAKATTEAASLSGHLWLTWQSLLESGTDQNKWS